MRRLLCRLVVPHRLRERLSDLGDARLVLDGRHRAADGLALLAHRDHAGDLLLDLRELGVELREVELDLVLLLLGLIWVIWALAIAKLGLNTQQKGGRLGARVSPHHISQRSKVTK